LRAFIWGLCGLVLTACSQFSPPTKSLQLVDGTIAAHAPDGYCVDPVVSRAGDGFAVMAPCSALGSNQQPPDVHAVATVQVGPPQSALVANDEEAVVSFLASEDGAGLLSGSGTAEDIEVLSATHGADTVTIHFSDAGAPPFDGLDQEEWRSFTDIGGRLVTVSVRGLIRRPLESGAGARMVSRILLGLTNQDENQVDDDITES